LAHSGIINSPNFNTAADIVPEAGGGTQQGRSIELSSQFKEYSRAHPGFSIIQTVSWSFWRC
jgi:hypothetical protein